MRNCSPPAERIYIPSESRRHHLKLGLMQAFGILVACVLIGLMGDPDQWGVLAAIMMAVYAFSLIFIVSDMFFSVRSWKRERKVYSHMLQAKYPDGLALGKKILDAGSWPMNSRGALMEVMHAIYTVLVEEGYDVNFLLVMPSRQEDRIAVLESRGCILTPDGGRTSELFDEKDRRFARLFTPWRDCQIYFSHIDDQSFERDMLINGSAPFLTRARAYFQSISMDRDTTHTGLAPIRVARL